MAPLFGYNTNLRHGKVLYHIQTEDSGEEHGNIATHVFVEGGRILDSRKTNYSHLLAQPDWQMAVRELMKKQHKDLCIAIRDGHYDLVPGPQGDHLGAAPPRPASLRESAVEPAPLPEALEQLSAASSASVASSHPATSSHPAPRARRSVMSAQLPRPSSRASQRANGPKVAQLRLAEHGSGERKDSRRAGHRSLGQVIMEMAMEELGSENDEHNRKA